MFTYKEYQVADTMQIPVTSKFSSIFSVHNILTLSQDLKLRTGKSSELYFKVTSLLILFFFFFLIICIPRIP